MNLVVICVAVMLGAAATLVVLRLVRGPSALDRVVAMDMLLAIIVCALASIAAFTHDSTTVPVLVVVALLGFMGSVAVAGFLSDGKAQHQSQGSSQKRSEWHE